MTPALGSTVVDVDETGVTTEHADRATRRIPARTVVWAAGVTASGLASRLAELTGAEQDHAGRITVELAALSGNLIAPAFVGQMSRLGAAFYAFGLILLPVPAVVGSVTFVRLVRSNSPRGVLSALAIGHRTELL